MTVGDDELVAELERARGFRRVMIAAALGDSTGTTGPEALRSLMQETGKGTQDLRCAAILALAKRCREEATDDCIAALSDSDGTVRDYARFGLAAYGEDGAWDLTLRQLGARLRRPAARRTAPPTPLAAMVTYLIRHLEADPGRHDRLADALERGWPTIDRTDRDWLASIWPDFDPESAGVPEERPDVNAASNYFRSAPLLARDPGTLDDPDLFRR